MKQLNKLNSIAVKLIAGFMVVIVLILHLVQFLITVPPLQC